MPQLDPTHFPSQLFWLCVIFGLLYVCIHLWIVPRIKKGLHARHHYIDHKLKEISSFQKAIEELEIKRERKTQEKNDEIALSLEKLKELHKALLKKEQEKLKKDLEESQKKFEIQMKKQAEMIAQELETYKSELVALTISQLSSSSKDKEKEESAL